MKIHSEKLWAYSIKQLSRKNWLRKEKVKALSYELEQQEQESNNVERFIAKVHKYFDLQGLTPDVLNDLVKRVEVYASENINGRRTQHIDIYYDFVGLLPMSLLQSKMNNSIA